MKEVMSNKVGLLNARQLDYLCAIANKIESVKYQMEEVKYCAEDDPAGCMMAVKETFKICDNISSDLRHINRIHERKLFAVGGSYVYRNLNAVI